MTELMQSTRSATKTRAGLPCSHKRLITPDIPLFPLPPVFLLIFLSFCDRSLYKGVLPRVPPGSLSRTLYVGRWPFPGTSHNPADSIDWWNLAGALL